MKFYFLSLFLGLYSHASEPLLVVNSFSILNSICESLAKPEFECLSLIPRETDPHSYQPNPGNYKKLKNAKIFVTNGLHFEPWAEKVISSSGFKGEWVIATTGIKPIPSSFKGTTLMDPHAWQDPTRGIKYAENITKALTLVIPEKKEIFESRFKKFKEQLTEQDIHCRKSLSSLPSQKIILFHEGYNYLAEAYHLQFYSPIGINTNSDLSGKELSQTIELIKNQKIQMLLSEYGAQPKIIKVLTQETQIREVGYLIGDTLTSEAPSYIDLLRKNCQTLARSLSATKGK